METATWIGSILPLFITLFIIIPEQKRKKRIKVLTRIKKKKKGVLLMSSEAFKKHVGRRCQVITILEKKVSGTIVSVKDNWVEIETNKYIETINIDFIERFSISTS